MKNFLSITILIIFLGIFCVFVFSYKNKYEVIEVISANKLAVDINNNGITDNGEIICIDGIESFSLEPDEQFYNNYSKKYKLSKSDIRNIGYLAREYGQKTLLNKKVLLKLIKNQNSTCNFGKIYLDGTDYAEILLNSGYGIKNREIGNPDKFREIFEKSKQLNLVILNHHSNIYHTLECEYGNAAHDKILIPQKQLPKEAKPCHFCHNIKDKKHKKLKNKNKILNILTPSLKLNNGNISLYKFDYTKTLKPNSHCNTDVCKLIVKEINNAASTIDIAIYGYEDIPAITNALKNAKARGVEIRFVFDESSNPEKTYYKGNYIIENISNKSTSDIKNSENNKLMHNKFLIFDKTKVITGSMNYSKTGLSGYDANDVIVINSEHIAGIYEAEFEQMINGKFHNSKIKQQIPNKFILGNSEIEVYFSPQDKAAQRIIQLINNAKHYVYIPTFLITHKGITDAILNAKKRNVDIKIIIDANSVNTRNTKHKILRESGILLKAENYAGKLHSKTLIIDDEYLIIGSMNFSNSGENKNDENILVIKNSNFARNYKEFFLYLWEIIPDKYLKYSPKAESQESIGSCSDGVDNNFDGKIDNEDEGCKLINK